MATSSQIFCSIFPGNAPRIWICHRALQDQRRSHNRTRPALDRGIHISTENARGEWVIKHNKLHGSGAPSLGYNNLFSLYEYTKYLLSASFDFSLQAAARRRKSALTAWPEPATAWKTKSCRAKKSVSRFVFLHLSPVPLQAPYL